MRSEVLQLRLPRLATGHVGRGREAVRIAAWDDVPVEVRAPSAGEAPVGFLHGHGDPTGVRIHDGASYEPLGFGATPSEGWAGVMGEIGRQLEYDLDMAPRPAQSPYSAVLPFAETLKGASRKHGFADGRALPFREVVDDGTAAQRRMADDLAGRLAVIEGRLWLRHGLPRLSVVRFGTSIRGMGAVFVPRHDHDRVMGAPWDVDTFRVDRIDEAKAYVAALVRDRGGKVDGTLGEPTVVDRDALDDCYARVGGDDALAMRAIAHTVLAAVRETLPRLPAGEIRRHVALMDLVDAGDTAGIRGWMAGLAETHRAIGEAYPRQNSVYRGRMGEHEIVIEAALTRLDAVEIPRMTQAADAGPLAAFGA